MKKILWIFILTSIFLLTACGRKDLGLNYSSDKENIYYEKNIVQNADINSFEVLKIPEDVYGAIAFKLKYWNYAKDKKHFYKNGEKIESLEITRFIRLTNAWLEFRDLRKKDKLNNDIYLPFSQEPDHTSVWQP